MTVRRTLTRLWVLASAAAACALLMVQTSFAGAVPLRGNHPVDAATLSRAVHAERSMPLDLTIILGLRNRAALTEELADQQNPSSPRYHKWLTPAEFAKRFGPADKQIDEVRDWLEGEGLKIVSVNRIARSIRAKGDAETAERAFSTTLVSDGVSFANTT